MNSASDEQIVKSFQRKAGAGAARGKAKNADVVHERIVIDSDDNDDSKEANKRKRKNAAPVNGSQP